jgi:hypothetical protein
MQTVDSYVECCVLQDEQECSESSYQVHELRAEAAGHLCIQLPPWHNGYVVLLFILIHNYIHSDDCLQQMLQQP